MQKNLFSVDFIIVLPNEDLTNDLTLYQIIIENVLYVDFAILLHLEIASIVFL